MRIAVRYHMAFLTASLRQTAPRIAVADAAHRFCFSRNVLSGILCL